MTHPFHVSRSPKTGQKKAPKSLHFRRVFAHCETLSGESAEAKKRMFNLPNRNPIENKGTLEDRTGPNRRFEPERSGGMS